MQFYRLFVACMLSVVLFSAGCSTKKVNFNNPESVAKAYAEAVNKLDFDGAKQYCTEGTASMMDMLKSLLDVMGAEEKKKMEEETKKYKVTKISCKSIEGDKRECRYCCNAEGQDEEAPVILVRQGDKWLVDIPKDETTPEMPPAEEGTDD